jgi:hypothetical protein
MPADRRSLSHLFRGRTSCGPLHCGAQTESDALADKCQFCGAALIADPGRGELIAPEAVLPFAVDRNGVRAALSIMAPSPPTATMTSAWSKGTLP